MAALKSYLRGLHRRTSSALSGRRESKADKPEHSNGAEPSTSKPNGAEPTSPTAVASPTAVPSLPAASSPPPPSVLTAAAVHTSPPTPFMSFPSRRSTVHSTHGIVTSTQPLASQAGLKILAQGGNAADAAVAVAAALNVTEPSSTGIGGDMFCLFYRASDRTVHALNGSGRAGGGTSLEQVRRELGLREGEVGAIPMTSVHAVTVPGAAAGWVDVVERFGVGKVSLSEVLAPAVEMAEEGFAVHELAARFWKDSEAEIKAASSNYAEILKSDPAAPDGCRAPRAGEVMKNPAMAATFRALGERGRKGFYEGAVAEAIVKVVADLGGHLTLDDLRKHGETGSEGVEAITLNFKGQGVNAEHGGVDVWEHPPNGQGIVALMALGLLEELERTGKVRKWKPEEHNSAEHLHAVIEVLRIAFADASWWVTDPNVVKVPTKELLSREYLAERAKLFDPHKASDILDHGSPAHNHCDTVYFAVTDRWGNGISFINSNYGGFGTAIIPAGCGFTLQNRGANFSLSADHPNVYAPGKRPYHTIIPALITNPKDKSLHSVYGVMGGFMQPQGHVQVLLNMLAFGHSPQAALDAPRFCVGAGMPNDGKVFSRMVNLEEGISEEVVEQLREMGHEVQVVKGHARGLFGRGQVIRVHHDDGQIVYSAGSDPRGDGAAHPA
ncbi:gamma-glutamyltranspeptidase [Trichodelitschia bisporula]|uniref:Gamma-glutamyltranspeptidase n=1 Tax=Trichodelitschia bisporula TaxID=703511 RepID=A0A6G1I6V7_9PEZI|nr:gamma-glutamyltranspeptidase [Trichodelitschia bisporula]